MELAWEMALLMLLGTLAGAVLFFAWSGFLERTRRPRGANEPGALDRLAWPTVEMITQFWTLGVLLAPGLFYSPSRAVAGLPDAVQWAGVLVWAGGGSLALWSTRVLGQAMRPKIIVAEGQRLVRTGPYARVRHPMYTALVLIAVGMGVAFLSSIALVLAMILYILARRRAILEEELLSSLDGFGEEYSRYMKGTGRFLPRSL